MKIQLVEEDKIMQTVRKLEKRSGFTLVELLIVIIIIGILAGAMMMLAGSGSDRAEATKIISDLRGMKAAALMYYADDANATVPAAKADALAALEKYMDRKIDDAKYNFIVATDGSGLWFVGREGLTTKGVQDALKNGAADSGLLATATSADIPGNNYAGGANVYMRAK